MTITPSGGVRRINELNGDFISEFIPVSDPNLTIPLDIAIDDTGKVYVIDQAADGATYRVLRYSSAGAFETELIAPRAMNAERSELRPRIEIGPDGGLYLSDPLTGNITRHDRITGFATDDPFTTSGSSTGLSYASFLAFAQPEFVYQVTTNNPLITGYVNSQNELQIPIPDGFSGSVQVSVGVFDGANAAQDFRGRSTEFRFDLHVGKGAIYGNVFDDLDSDGINDVADPGVENVTVFWDLDNDTRFDAGEPTSRTDADGNYALTGLSYGTHDVRIFVPGNFSATTNAIAVSSGTPVITNLDFALFQEISAGPDQVVDEGDPTFTVSVRRSAFASQAVYDWTVGMSEDGVIANVTGANSDTFHFDALSEGQYTVTVTVTVVGFGLQFTDMVDVFVKPVAPTIDVGADITTAEEGIAITRDLSVTDPGTDSWLITIDYGDGTIEHVNDGEPTTNRNFSLNHIYADPGNYTVTVTVANDEGSDTDSLNVAVAHASPHITFTPRGRSHAEGDSVLLDVTIDDPTAQLGGTLAQWSFSIDWSDGQTENFASSVSLLNASQGLAALSHVYADNGRYPVTVTVVDNDGDQGQQSDALVITNVAPVLTSLIAPTTMVEGQIGTFTARFTDAGAADTHTISWDWGDGSGISDGATAQHAFGDNGTYTVTVTVTDDDGGTDSQTFDITVTNAAPSLIPTSDQTIEEGSLLSITDIASFTDAGFGITETFTYFIDWGDGSAIETGAAPRTFSETIGGFAFGSFNGSHVYADDGMYLVKLRITDDDGGSTDTELLPNNGGSGLIAGTGDSNSFLVTVTGVAPSVTTVGNQSLNEGRTLTLTDIATFTDPGFTAPANHSVEEFAFSIDWGDGTKDTGTAMIDENGGIGQLTSGSFDGSHRYADSGKYSVKITVTDDDGDATIKAFGVTINNLAPTLTLNPTPSQVTAGENFMLSGSFSDIAADTVDVTVNVGDGIQRNAVITGNQFQFSHVFNSGGNKTITVTATDDDGGATSSSVSVTINGVDSAPVSGGAASASGTEDDATISGNVPAATDADFDTLTYHIAGPTPAGVTFNPNGTFSVVPKAADQALDSGESRFFTFKYVANDGVLNSGLATVTVTINGLNDAPVSGGAASASGTEDDATINGSVPAASDVDVERLTYHVVGATPAGVTFNANGTFSVVPTAADQTLATGESRVITFQYAASDGTSDSGSATATVTTNDLNDAPVITSNGGGATGSKSVAENSTAVTTVVAADVDTSDIVTYSIVGGADRTRFTINETAGALSFVAAPNFEKPTDNGLNNTYVVQVQAADGHGGTTSQTITVTVTDVVELPDLQLVSFVADGSNTAAGHPRLTVIYEVQDAALPAAFQIQFLKSTDAIANLGTGGDHAERSHRSYARSA